MKTFTLQFCLLVAMCGMLLVSDTYMTAAPATGATTGKVTVLMPAGNLTTPQKFKVTPTIKKFSPTSGPVGTSVVITGTSLSQASAVKFGTVVATFTVNSDTQVTATVPTGAVTAKISVTTPGERR
jgi:large repetitive protein